jgi:hypothetical protein
VTKEGGGSTYKPTKGTVQEMLPQQPSPVQAMQWPLEKHLMIAQIVPEPS